MTSLSVLTIPSSPRLCGAVSPSAALALAGAAQQFGEAKLRQALQQIPDWQDGPWGLRWQAIDGDIQVLVAESVQGQAVVALGQRESAIDSEQQWRRLLAPEQAAVQLAPWPYGRLASSACVLRSTVDYVRRVDGLNQGRLRLVDAVRSLSAERPIICIGHGWAGALCSALAPWLESQSPIRSRRRLQCISFGAPAIGNQAFADGCAEHYGAATGRHYNRLDPYPYLWGGLSWLIRSYVGAVSAPDWMIQRGLALIEMLRREGSHCRQPVGGIALQGQISGSDCWLDEARRQHSISCYERLLQLRFWQNSGLY